MPGSLSYWSICEGIVSIPSITRPEKRSAVLEKDVPARIENGRTGASPVSTARSACGQHVDKAAAAAPAAAAGDPDIMVRVCVYVRCTCAMHPRVAPCARCIAFAIVGWSSGAPRCDERGRERQIRTSSRSPTTTWSFKGRRTSAYVYLYERTACLAKQPLLISGKRKHGNGNCTTEKDACDYDDPQSIGIIFSIISNSRRISQFFPDVSMNFLWFIIRAEHEFGIKDLIFHTTTNVCY